MLKTILEKSRKQINKLSLDYRDAIPINILNLNY